MGGQAACIEEVLTGVYCIMVSVKGPVSAQCPSAHLVNILVTAVSWLSIVVVGGGVSSLLRKKHSEH